MSSTASPAGPLGPAEALLQFVGKVEAQLESLGEALNSFEKSAATLPHKELTHLREGLKRMASRLDTSEALAGQLGVEPEKGQEAVVEGEERQPVVTPEDEAFPLAGFCDELTGLPSRRIAQKAIESALEVGRPRYVAVFCLDRVCHMSNRYGGEMGKQALRHCAQFLAAGLPAEALSFRWRGAAFAALFDCPGTAGEARVLMEQVAIQKQKFNFVTNHRSAMVKLTLSLLTIPLSEHDSASAVVQAADHFVETHSLRQPH